MGEKDQEMKKKGERGSLEEKKKGERGSRRGRRKVR